MERKYTASYLHFPVGAGECIVTILRPREITKYSVEERHEDIEAIKECLAILQKSLRRRMPKYELDYQI